MAHALTDVDSLRPAGSKRSSKRESILDVFLRHEGHLSADDLYDLVRRDDRQISRATVYRALQWMVEAGIARKVDFGEGRFRFEHSYRHPRHFHLICQSCNRSAEFLSSDIEALIEEIAAAQGFLGAAERAADLRHLRGVPHRAGRGSRRGDERAAVRARRDAHRDRDRALRVRLLHPRRPRGGRRAHQGRVPAAGRRRARAPGGRRAALPAAAGAGPAARVATHVPVLQGGGQRPVRGRRRAGGARPRPRAGADDRHPVRAGFAPVLQTVWRAVRGPGRPAALPRVRGRRAGAPGTAHSRIPRAQPAAAPPTAGPRAAAHQGRRRDRSPPPYDCVRRPLVAPDSSCRPPGCAGIRVLAVTDHDTVAGLDLGRRRLRRGRDRMGARRRDHLDAGRGGRARARLLRRPPVARPLGIPGGAGGRPACGASAR